MSFKIKRASDYLGPYDGTLDWFVKPIIPAGLTVLYGQRSKGKTFVGLSIAAALAAEKPWLRQFEVPSSERVLYIWGEGKPDKRVNAVAARFGIPGMDDVYILEGAVDFTNNKDVKRLIADIEELGISYIVVDHFAACSTGTENDDSVQKSFLRGLHEVRDACSGASALVLMHALDQNPTEPRGNKTILNMADCVINLTSTGHDALTLTCKKPYRDAAPFAPVYLALKQAEIEGEDEQEHSSFVVELRDVPNEIVKQESTKAPRGGRRRPTNVDRLYAALERLGGAGDTSAVLAESGIRPGSFHKAKTQAAESGLIGINGTTITLLKPLPAAA